MSAAPPRQKSKVGRLRIKASQLQVSEETLSCNFLENHRCFQAKANGYHNIRNCPLMYPVADEVRDITNEDLTARVAVAFKWESINESDRPVKTKLNTMGQGNSLSYISCEMSMNISSLMLSLRPQLVQFFSVPAATLPVGACGEFWPGFCGPGGFLFVCTQALVHLFLKKTRHNSMHERQERAIYNSLKHNRNQCSLAGTFPDPPFPQSGHTLPV